VEFVEVGVVGIERGGAVLAEVADLGIAAVGEFAFLKFDFAGEDFDESGFASLSGAQQKNTLL
jgi:hypothetical protein